MTNITHYSVKIIVLALFRSKAKIVLHYTHICHDCTTVVYAVISVKYRVRANMITRTVPISEKKTSFVLVPTST